MTARLHTQLLLNSSPCWTGPAPHSFNQTSTLSMLAASDARERCDESCARMCATFGAPKAAEFWNPGSGMVTPLASTDCSLDSRRSGGCIGFQRCPQELARRFSRGGGIGDPIGDCGNEAGGAEGLGDVIVHARREALPRDPDPKGQVFSEGEEEGGDRAGVCGAVGAQKRILEERRKEMRVGGLSANLRETCERRMLGGKSAG